MQIDKEWLGHWFDRFNHDYFADRLPRPRLSVGRSRTRLGSMTCRRQIRMLRTVRTDYAIRLSNYYDQSERQFQNVLLHEMIHYDLAYSGQRDSSPHGPLFRSRMNELNRLHGWEITVTTSVCGLRVVGGMTKRKTYLVLALTMQTGHRVLSVVNPRYARHIDQILRTASDVTDHGWYTSSDTYFAVFPCVRSPRGHRVPPALFDEKVSRMTPFSLR
ncbi:MAG: SprT-like domain-containing protein [Prevotella sp.]|nr:SprT-like domain-containing protein [Prevotella sp.]